MATSSEEMRFTAETLEEYAKKYTKKAGKLQALIDKAEAIKMLHEDDLGVYGDGHFPIQDYLHTICTSPKIGFPDYVQAVSMAMGSPLDNVVRENFVKLDKDRSGFLDQKELGALLDDCLNEKERKDQVKELLSSIDVDKDGKVNYVEIVKAICF